MELSRAVKVAEALVLLLVNAKFEIDPPAKLKSEVTKPVTGSLKVKVTFELLSLSSNELSTMFTVTVGGVVSELLGATGVYACVSLKPTPYSKVDLKYSTGVAVVFLI